jgi:hypothetical protein
MLVVDDPVWPFSIWIWPLMTSRSNDKCRHYWLRSTGVISRTLSLFNLQKTNCAITQASLTSSWLTLLVMTSSRDINDDVIVLRRQQICFHSKLPSSFSTGIVPFFQVPAWNTPTQIYSSLLQIQSSLDLVWSSLDPQTPLLHPRDLNFNMNLFE